MFQNTKIVNQDFCLLYILWVLFDFIKILNTQNIYNLDQLSLKRLLKIEQMKNYTHTLGFAIRAKEFSTLILFTKKTAFVIQNFYFIYTLPKTILYNYKLQNYSMHNLLLETIYNYQIFCQ